MDFQKIKRLKKLARERMLKEEEEFGKPRSKSWGGKDSTKKDRRSTKGEFKKFLKGDMDEI